MNVLQYSPGSLVTVILQTLNDLGLREDGYSTPSVTRVIMPDLSESMLYPLDMIRISEGLYYHKFMLPSSSAAVGSYIVDLLYTNVDGYQKNDLTQVICTASSGGNFSISPG